MSCAESRTVALELPRQAAQQRDDPGDAANVQIGERFVEQKQARAPDEGMGDHDALLLAAGEGADALVREAGRVNGFQHFVDLSPARPRGQRQAEPVAVEAKRHEVPRPHRQIRIERELLRDIADRRERAAAVDGDAAAAGRQQAEDGAQQRRLARPVGADQAAELPRREREVDVLENGRGQRARRPAC